MRFHFGISKFIKPSKLLKWLGIAFVGLLAYFGLVQQGYAWTNISSNDNIFTIGPTINYLDISNNFSPVKLDLSPNDIIRRGNDSSYYSYGLKDTGTYYEFYKQIYAINQYGVSQYGLNKLTEDVIFYFNNSSSYCPNSSNDLKSINMKFPLYMDNSYTDYAFFNQPNQASTFDVRLIAYDSTNQLQFTTTCSKELVGGYTGSYYLVTCNNVFQGNNNYSIDFFGFQINNTIPFNDYFSNDTSSFKGIGGFFEIGNRWYTFRNEGINYLMSYECNDEPPVFNEPINGGDDDPAGLNDIYDHIKTNYNDNIGGIDTSKFLRVPGKFSDLLNLPFAFIETILDNSSNSCTNYELDLSGLMNVNGGDNTYKIQLPCMRQKLSSLLGNWYLIFDILICFYLFYDISMHIISLINAILSGQDLYSYFFKSSTDKAYPDNYTGGET